MDLQYVRKLVKLLSESTIDEIEIEEEGSKIRVARNPHGAPVLQAAAFPSAAQQAAALQAAAPQGVPAEPAPPSPQAPAAAGLHEIKSPIVGTFYRSPAPDAAPFVQVGSVIRPGAVLCIVEAMKLMNEIEADVAGTITGILVEDGQSVEYGQPLFKIS